MDDEFDFFAKPLKRERDTTTHMPCAYPEPFSWQLPASASPQPALNSHMDIAEADTSDFVDPSFPMFAKSRRPPGLLFMNDCPDGDATLTYPSEDGTIESIGAINLFMLECRCPLLATAFEPSRSGPRLHLQILSSLTAIPFLRYLYTGSYAEFNFYEDVPTSVLLHCQLYFLATVYDIEELRSQAYVNVLRQCEFGCSSPEKPIDLCPAISFAYKSLREHGSLTEAVVHYCISRFLDHKLGEDRVFTEMAYECRPFYQDLVKTCRDRGYEDESAAAIIQLPYKPYTPDTYASREDPAIARFRQDLQFHFHGSDDTEKSPSKRRRISRESSAKVEEEQPISMKLPLRPATSVATPKSLLTLAIREQRAVDEIIDDDSTSDEEELRIVRKRKASSRVEPPASATTLDSESDFELVAGPAAVEALSTDDESDVETLVEVDMPPERELSSAQELSIRTPETAATAAASEPAGEASDWEAEWEDLM